jgi:hypothetical protein
MLEKLPGPSYNYDSIQLVGFIRGFNGKPDLMADCSKQVSDALKID